MFSVTFNSQKLSDLISAELAQWRAKWPSTTVLNGLADGLVHYTKGGKRLRARGVQLGFSLADGASQLEDACLTGQVAVELYQASALAHDDIVDNADLRRGAPSLHRFYESWHKSHNFRGNEQTFGQNCAILVGDLLLSLSQQVANRAADLANSKSARDTFAQMTAEVAVGQFLDCALEDTPVMDNPGYALEAALDVVKHKAARYSVALPVIFGAQLAGASEALTNGLEKVLEPWGSAFQLRDDQLGVFGDDQIMGKATGADLIEGKRTVLVALTLKRLGKNAEEFLAALGTDLSEREIDKMRQTISACGAYDDHEQLIASLLQDGEQHLAQLELPEAGKESLRQFRNLLVNRQA